MIDAQMAFTIANNAKRINNFLKAVDEGILDTAQKGAFDFSVCISWSVPDDALNHALQQYIDAGYKIRCEGREVEKQLKSVPYGEYEMRHVRFYWDKKVNLEVDGDEET